MIKRRRFKQQLTLQDRLTAWVKQVQKEASGLPPGPEQDALLKKARQAELANHLHDWVNPPGLHLRNPRRPKDDAHPRPSRRPPS